VVAKPDIFISIHTNASDDTTARGPIYVPYKTHPYDQDWSFPERSTVWSPSHGFNVDWYVGSDTSSFDTEVSMIQDTPVLLANYDYHFRIKDKDANPIDPYTLRHQIFDLAADTEFIGSTLSDTVEGLGTYDGRPDRQVRGKVYSNAFNFPETGPYRTDLRGPFQADQQDTIGLDLVDTLDDVVDSNRADPDVNCSDGGNCDLALGSWLGDIRDKHDPAFVLSEVAFHTNPNNAEWLINNCETTCGFDSAAERIANVLDPYSPISQDDKFKRGKEIDRPHPFEVRTLTMQGKVRNRQSGYLLGSYFQIKLTAPAGNDFSGTGPGNTTGVIISDFDTGTYSGTVTQVGGSGGSTLDCPQDWSTFYEQAETGPVELHQEFDGDAVVQHTFYVWPQGRFSGTVSDSSTGEFLQNATVKIIPEGNNDTGVTQPNAPPIGSSHGSYHFCGIDQTDVDADPPFSYTITASLDGYFSDTITGLTMTADTIIQVDTLLLQPKPGQVHGNVYHAVSNDLLSNVNHDLKDDTGEVIESDSSWQGDFEFLDVEPGDYDIISSKTTATVYVTDTTSITVNPGDSLSVDIPLTGYNDIRVHVTKESNGKNAQGETVTLKMNGSVIDYKHTGYGSNSGIARFYDYEPGNNYTVEVTGDYETINPLPESDFPDGEGTVGTTCGVDDCVAVELVVDDT